MSESEGEQPPQAMHCFVSGRVQGVGYRLFVQRHARRLRVAGWVRNLGDGRVEVRMEGAGNALAEMRRLLAQGPPGAAVERLQCDPAAPEGHAGFTAG